MAHARRSWNRVVIREIRLFEPHPNQSVRNSSAFIMFVMEGGAPATPRRA
jgi:hypothetical protein